MTRRHALLLATTGLTVAGLAACGDPITANHDWRGATALVTLTEQVNGQTVQAAVLAGKLIDPQGKIVPGTIVRETCLREKTTGSQTPAYKCLALINTSLKTYVAGGPAAGPFGTLKSLATNNSPNTLTFTKLSGTQPANQPIIVKISAHKG